MAEELPARDVDAGEERRGPAERLLPVAELPGGAVEDEEAERDDQAGALGHRDEIGRRDAAELRVVPADQRLEAGDRLVVEPDDGLIEDLDLLAAEGPAEVRLQRGEVGAVLAERRAEGLDAVAAEPLGVVHADLGVLDQLLGLDLLAVVHGDADRGGEEDLLLAEGDRRAERARAPTRRTPRCAPAGFPR